MECELGAEHPPAAAPSHDGRSPVSSAQRLLLLLRQQRQGLDLDLDRLPPNRRYRAPTFGGVLLLVFLLPMHAYCGRLGMAVNSILAHDLPVIELSGRLCANITY